MTEKPLSIRAYAKHRGVSEAAVRKALGAHQIVKGAHLDEEGRRWILPSLADAEWTAGRRGKGGPSPAPPAPKAPTKAASPPPAGAPLSLRAYAKHAGVSEAAVRKAIQGGRLAKALLPDGRVDPTVADREWQRNTGLPRGGGAPSFKPEPAREVPVPELEAKPGARPASLVDAKVQVTNLQADTMELQLRRLQGELVELAMVEEVLAKVLVAQLGTVRAALLSVGARVAPRLVEVAHQGLVVVQQVIEDAVNEALLELQVDEAVSTHGLAGLSA